MVVVSLDVVVVELDLVDEELEGLRVVNGVSEQMKKINKFNISNFLISKQK